MAGGNNMKKLLLVMILIFILTGCTIPFQSSNTTTTISNVAQLDQESLDNIKQQVMNELRQEMLNLYAKELTETESMIVNMVKANAAGVLGVSNFKENSGILYEASSGSGVIYKYDSNEKAYYVITNEHVVRDADELSIVLPDLTLIDAELIGADEVTDIAVIKFISTKTFPVIQFADSDSLLVGQFAIAIGNPLGQEYYGSVTSGIVSGLSRNLQIDYDDDNVIDWNATLIQHDAAISPGNSGGGLFDIKGKLIGINNMKIVSDNVSNIGFAIPSNTVKYISEQLEEHREVIRPSLGITGMAVTDIIQNNNLINAGLYDGEIVPIPNGITSGIYVFSIVENSSSSNSDLKIGDIIMKYNEIETNTFEDLKLQIDNAKVDDVVILTVYRNMTTVEVSMTLIKKPGL